VGWKLQFDQMDSWRKGKLEAMKKIIILNFDCIQVQEAHFSQFFRQKKLLIVFLPMIQFFWRESRCNDILIG
jgi:hypothetical protein